MILLKRSKFYFFFITVSAIILTLAVYSYWVFTHFNLMNDPNLKYYSETFILLVILFLLILFYLFIHLLTRNKDIYKELDKVIDLSRQGNLLSESQLKKIDLLGEKIMEINGILNSLNEKKTLKITAQSNLINFLISHVNKNMLVTDIQGRIERVTPTLLHKFNVEEKDITGEFINVFVQNLNFSVITNDLKSSKNISFEASVKFNKDDEFIICYLVFYPIYNVRNELTNCVCFIMDETEFLSSLKETNE